MACQLSNIAKDFGLETHVVRRIGMVIDTAKERSRRILANHLSDEMTTARVLVHESGHVVDEASDNDERALERLLLEALPVDDREVGAVGGPGQVVLLLAETLELHRELALLDFVVGEDLEVAGETEFRADPDEPLRRVVLVPLDGVTVVHGELVVEVVVALANRAERSYDVVAGSVLIVERSLTEPVRERVHAEGGLQGLSALVRRQDRKSTRLNSSHSGESRMPSSA